MIDLSEVLEPIASQFRSLGLPEAIVHWGHPLMMAIVVFVMGSYVGWSGWRGRVAPDKDAAIKGRSDHRQLAPWMFLFMALGYTGGVLSLVMQRQPILESPHFWTGSILLVLLALNGAVLLALNGAMSLRFQGDRLPLRAAHAYLGTVALGLMLVHALLGLKLGLSI